VRLTARAVQWELSPANE